VGLVWDSRQWAGGPWSLRKVRCWGGLRGRPVCEVTLRDPGSPNKLGSQFQMVSSYEGVER